jgi:hypothetical protein
MANWEQERRRVWGIIIELKHRIKMLEEQNCKRKEGMEQPPEVAGAERMALMRGRGPC